MFPDESAGCRVQAIDDSTNVRDIQQTVLRTGRRKELLGEIEMDGALYSLPTLIGDALWLTTSNRLYLIETTR